MTDLTTISRRVRFTTIANSAVRDDRLSLTARGLLTLLCSYEEGWEFRQAHLMKVTGCGRDKLRALIRELTDIGYLTIAKKQDLKGRFTGYLWTISDDPDPCETDRLKTRHSDNRVTENPAPVKPDVGEIHPLKKTKVSKNTKCKKDDRDLLGDVSAPEPKPKHKTKAEVRQGCIDILSQKTSRSVATDFVDHRIEIKKPLTERAARAMLTKIGDHKRPDAVLTETVANGWQGIYPEKVPQSANQPAHNRPRTYEEIEREKRMAFYRQVTARNEFERQKARQ